MKIKFKIKKRKFKIKKLIYQNLNLEPKTEFYENTDTILCNRVVDS